MGWRTSQWLALVVVSGCCFTPRPTTSPECAAAIDAAVRGDHAALEATPAEVLRCHDAEGHEPIHHAAQFGSAMTVVWFLDHGVPLEAPGGRERTPFYQSIRGSRLETASILLERGANIEARNDRGATPWMMAASRSDLAALEMLLAHGADTRAVDDEGGDAAIVFVSSNELSGPHPEVLAFLLDHGSEVDLRDAGNRTGLHMAIHRRRPDWVAVLLDHGANPNVTLASGTTPLDAATRDGLTDIVTLLNARGAWRSDWARVDTSPPLARSYRVSGEVVRAAGARPAPMGTRCTVVVRPMDAVGGLNCTVTVDCDGGGHLYGGSGSGATVCDLSSGSLRAFDPWPTGGDYDPAMELDLAARRFVVDDGLPGREGTRVTLLLDPFDPAAPPAPAP